MTTVEAIKHLTEQLDTDMAYRIGWKANIAMAFCDEWQRSVDHYGLPTTPDHIHKIANKAADSFIERLCYRPQPEEDKP